MKLIDRLIIKANESAGVRREHLTLAMVSPNDGGYFASCRLWDGKKGGGVRELTSVHSSTTEALAAVEMAGHEYPNRYSSPVIIVDDLDESSG